MNPIIFCETNEVSRIDTSSSSSPSSNQSPSINPCYEDKESKTISESEQGQHDPCLALLHGPSIRGSRTLLINEEA